jgi:hypothetical protein
VSLLPHPLQSNFKLTNTEPTALLTVSQQFTILSAIEDLETVTPRVYAQCEECFRSTLTEYHSRDSDRPSPRSLLKKSVNLNTSSFSVIGNDILETARTRSGSGSASVGGSAVLVGGDADRGWDWRAGLSEDVSGEDILRMLRLGLAKGLSCGALGAV